MNLHRNLWRRASSYRPFGRPHLAALALGCAGLLAGDGASLAQVSEEQVRCMQLEQELAAAQGGGGANGEELRHIQDQIAKAERVFQGTKAALEDAGCIDSFFIFGRGLVRSPKCLRMNARVEDARRDLTALKQQRKILKGGGGNRRRQAELQDALARSGCAGAPKPRRGGLFDFFGIGRQEEDYYQRPIYRSINPNGRYRSVCVRLCDGFYYPINYSVYGSQLGPDSEACQSSCAAPAELYVYRNPGQEIEQAVSLTGSAYMDLPVALRYRKEYVKGCSCKQSEYNPTAIEGANKRAEADPNAVPPAQQGAAGAPAPQAVAPATAPGEQPAPQASPEVTGSTPPAEPGAPAAIPAAVPPEQGLPALPGTAVPPPPPAEAAAIDEAPPVEGPVSVPPEQSLPSPPPAPTAAAPEAPPPAAAIEEPEPAPPPVVKRRRPAPPPASPFGPQ